MPQSKYDELKSAIRDYGRAAFENLVKCRALGDAIIEGFHRYEGCDSRCVVAVPPVGAFDPRKDYGDEAYSVAGREVVILEPVRFGLCLIVGNVEDQGSLWLRTVISMEMVGAAYDVFVASRPLIHVPLDFEGKLDPVFEAAHQEFVETFTLEVNEFNDTRFRTGIGFMHG
jgi:hypothetical protein